MTPVLKLLRALESGTVNLYEVMRVPKSTIREGWQCVIDALESSAKPDPALFTLLRLLRTLDRSYPSGPFLFGLALHKAGKPEAAKRWLQLQLRRPDGLHREACVALMRDCPSGDAAR